MSGTCRYGESQVQTDGKHHHGAPREIALEREIMAKNDGYAAGNHSRFHADQILALNLLSSPRSGKMELLVEPIKMLGTQVPCHVSEGDQQTSQVGRRGTCVVGMDQRHACRTAPRHHSRIRARLCV